MTVANCQYQDPISTQLWYGPTRERFLDIDHLPRARLHEAAALLPRPFEPLLAADHPLALQVALVSRHDLDRARLAVVHPPVLLHVDELREVLERVDAVGVGDVVDEQEGIGEEVRGRPEAAVFFLAGGVGQQE